MSNLDLRFRQIHLDFHASEFIDGISSQFDPKEFAATLEKVRVNSITISYARTPGKDWMSQSRSGEGELWINLPVGLQINPLFLKTDGSINDIFSPGTWF